MKMLRDVGCGCAACSTWHIIFRIGKRCLLVAMLQVIRREKQNEPKHPYERVVGASAVTSSKENDEAEAILADISSSTAPPVIVNAATMDETEDDDASDGSDDDDDDDDETWLDTLRSSWRQHCVALLVAVVAAILSLYYQRRVLSQATVVATREAPGRTLLERSPHPAAVRLLLVEGQEGSDALEQPSTFQQQLFHPHLRDFWRTSNISFCGKWTDANDNLFVTNAANEHGLELMDFNVPKNLMNIMESYFEADRWNGQNGDGSVTPEIECMKQLSENSSGHPFIKGATFYYKTPSLDSMYVPHIERHIVASIKKKAPSTIQPVELTFAGFVAKFINLTPKPILVHWDGRAGAPKRLVGEVAPFDALTTATKPGESFSASPVYDHSDALARWTVTPEDSIIYFEGSTRQQPTLTAEQDLQYKMQKLNREFAKHYLIRSGRNWLSNFPRRFPVHFMWNADRFGQVHSIETVRVDDHGNERKITLSMAVVSVTPRVFTIRNFLSPKECKTLKELALHQGLTGSTLYAGSLARQQRDRSTRSSSNAWLARSAATITDSIYPRSAHLLQIDEHLLQSQTIDEELNAHQHSVAESLQVIRYREGEEYAPHHDWVVSEPWNHYQPTRFATLLIYLNDDFEGGRTVFPRSVNSQNHDGVQIEPEQGMAVLFYNMLPDGNMDELSQHGSQPVTRGEKVCLIMLKIAMH